MITAGIPVWFATGGPSAPTPVTWTVVGAVVVLMTLMVRTLWRNDRSWTSQIRLSRDGEVSARRDAAKAHQAAAEAQEQAGAAMIKAAEASTATAECEAREVLLRARVLWLEDQLRRAGFPLAEYPGED